MQRIVLNFVKLCSENLPISGPIYEIGSLQVEGQEGYSDLRHLFPGKEYVGIDMRPGRGVDEVKDFTQAGLPRPANTIICCDTLEHVNEPFLFINNIYDSLCDDGIVIITVPFYFAIHEYPSDYFRYTPEGLKYLFRKFHGIAIGIGPDKSPGEVVGVFCKGDDSVLQENKFREALGSYVRTNSKTRFRRRVLLTVRAWTEK